MSLSDVLSSVRICWANMKMHSSHADPTRTSTSGLYGDGKHVMETVMEMDLVMVMDVAMELVWCW